MTDEETLNLLIDRAIKNETSSYEILNNYNEYRAAKIVRNALNKVATGFIITAKQLFKAYENNLKNSIDEPAYLIEYKKYKKCADFYTNEYNTLQETINEYETHLLAGNLIVDLLGYDRRDYE